MILTVNIFTLGLQLTDLKKKKKNCWNFLVPGGGCVKQYTQSPSVGLLEQYSFLYQRLQLAYLSDPRHHDFQLHLVLSTAILSLRTTEKVPLSQSRVNARRSGERCLHRYNTLPGVAEKHWVTEWGQRTSPSCLESG